MMNALESTSTRPYLIRALYEWCVDNGLTPYIAVLADDAVRVPREYVQNGEIVLNISTEATSALKLGNEFVEFKARFAGVAREIMVPINNIIAIYARESGQGMAFPVGVPAVAEGSAESADATSADQGDDSVIGSPGPIQLVPRGAVGNDDAPVDPPPQPKRRRPALKVVK
ncbi:MAG: ClpXP protease specificity-enhancing factor [Burkholderiaceae bacterium]|jgi:stringent starvation protein B|nr:ClpXP protease specificity-enhancing factor [Burkholderiaceae bacterium]